MDIQTRRSRAIWQAVILQAITDATSLSPKSDAGAWRIQAQAWLRLTNKDFMRACDYAEVDPYATIAAVEKMLENKQTPKQLIKRKDRNDKSSSLQWCSPQWEGFFQ